MMILRRNVRKKITENEIRIKKIMQEEKKEINFNSRKKGKKACACVTLILCIT